MDFRYTVDGSIKADEAGVSSQTIKTPAGNIVIMGGNTVTLPGDCFVVFQVPDGKSTKTVASVATSTVILEPGSGFYTKLPGGGTFGASLDWPKV